jgi:hypothetical protein
MGKNKPFWEIFIGVMIIAGLVLVFLEDICRLGGWSVRARDTLIVLGFIVDLVFSVEFVVRSAIASRGKTWKTWFTKGRGWIDLLSSWPLLLFVSGPLVMSMMFGGSQGIGFMGMGGLLRASRVFRIARVLRVFRFLRLLRLIKLINVTEAVGKSDQPDAAAKEKEANLEAKASVMVQVLFSFVLVLFVSAFLHKIFFTPDQVLAEKQKVYTGVLQDWYQSMYQNDMARLEHLKQRLQEDPDVLYVYNGATTLVNNLTTDEPPAVYFPKNWFYTDYKILTYHGIKLYYSNRDVERNNAKVNLLLETIVVVQILAVLLFFRREKTAA